MSFVHIQRDSSFVGSSPENTPVPEIDMPGGTPGRVVTIRAGKYPEIWEDDG